mgnify:CR=1 FL=1
MICFKSTKEVIGGGSVSGERTNPLVMIGSSFKNALKDWNVAWLVIAMILYLTGVFWKNWRYGLLFYLCTWRTYGYGIFWNCHDCWYAGC